MGCWRVQSLTKIVEPIPGGHHFEHADCVGLVPTDGLRFGSVCDHDFDRYPRHPISVAENDVRPDTAEPSLNLYRVHAMTGQIRASLGTTAGAPPIGKIRLAMVLPESD